ncbi:MAG: DUF2332 domain-containing protein [Alphaproteobacteria bacterium]|nr:DUF2332 domain-containing protein [Alphaproteobacteria bacterium]
MAMQQADYVVIDPQARGPEAVARAFANQVAYCRDNQAPITASVCEALHALLDGEWGERGGAVMRRVRKWAGPPLADALPLRVAGGLHALQLAGAEPELRPIYEGLGPTDAAARIAAALERHEAFLLPWLDGPPQTNEAGRSWGFAAAMLWLIGKGLPPRFALCELGSSAGINLMMDRYRFELGGVTAGPENAELQLAPEWRGPPPPQRSFEIVAARGCDVAPVDLTDPDQALRLKAYIWPEFTTRFARMDAAVALAVAAPPQITKCGAAEFLEQVLAQPQEAGVTRMVMHSVVWQYIQPGERARIEALMAEAGKRATPEAPLAWVSLEADRDTHRHELAVRYWPGGESWRNLGAAHPHGAWVEWAG